jgi:hypothetical protein
MKKFTQFFLTQHNDDDGSDGAGEIIWWKKNNTQGMTGWKGKVFIPFSFFCSILPGSIKDISLDSHLWKREGKHEKN